MFTDRARKLRHGPQNADLKITLVAPTQEVNTVDRPQRHYHAFISYRHRKPDMEIAKRLQTLLERHKKDKVPLCVFRDQSELPLSSDLGSDIHAALENSDYLIIICSSEYQKSRWCMEELRYFRELHGNSNRNILVVLVDGEPADVFPKELLHEPVPIKSAGQEGPVTLVPVEPLAADLRSSSTAKQLRRLKTEYMRIAAPLLGCSFDDLYQRAKRKKKNQVLALVSVIAALAVAFSIYSMYMLDQIQRRQELLEKKQAELYTNESRRLANESRELFSSDPGLALLLADAALPADLDTPDHPIETTAERVLRSASLNVAIQEQSQGMRLNTTVKLSNDIDHFYGDGRYFSVANSNHTWLYDAYTGSCVAVTDKTGIVFSASGEHYYDTRNIFADDTQQVIVDVYDTFTHQFIASHEVLRVPNGDFTTSFYDDRTSRYYFARITRKGHTCIPSGYIDATGAFIPCDEMPEEYGQVDGNQIRLGEIYGNRLPVDDAQAHATIETTLPEGFTLGDITRTRDGSLYFAELYAPEHTIYEYDEDSIFLLMDLEDMGDAVTVIHHPTNMPENAFDWHEEDSMMVKHFPDETTEGYFEVHQYTHAYTIIWDAARSREIGRLNGMCFQMADNRLFYNLRGNELRIYSYDPDKLADVQIDSEEYATYQVKEALVAKDQLFRYPRYAYLSKGGSRVARYILPQEAATGRQLEIYNIHNLKQPIFVLETAQAITMNASMTHVLAEQDLTLALYRTEDGACVFTTPSVMHSSRSFAINEDATLAVLAQPLTDTDNTWQVEVISTATGEVVQEFSLTAAFADQPYLEFSGRQLLAAFTEETFLLHLDDPEHTARYPVSGHESWGPTQMGLLPTAFRENSLVIVPGAEDTAYGTSLRINTIIDLNSNTVVPFDSRDDFGIESYWYSADGNVLIDQETDEFVVQFRQEDGSFKTAHRIAAQDTCHQIDPFLSACDGEYLVINEVSQTEIYSVATGEVEYMLPHSELHSPYYAIYNGVLYDMNSSTDQIVCYPLPDTPTAREWTQHHLTENGIRRYLTVDESEQYYIPADWRFTPAPTVLAAP